MTIVLSAFPHKGMIYYPCINLLEKPRGGRRGCAKSGDDPFSMLDFMHPRKAIQVSYEKSR
jgi:hypothetical protein